MKKLIALILILSVMMLLSSCGTSISEVFDENNIMSPQTTANDVKLKDYTLYSENNNLQLWFNENTTEFKVINKTDNSEWYSTNTGRDSNSSENALLVVSYLDSNGTVNTMDSLTNSVKNGQFKIKKGDNNSVIVQYSIGEFAEQTLVPPALSKQRYDEICANVANEFDKMKLKNYYYLVDINTITDATVKENYLSKYPEIKEQPMYIIVDTVMSNSNIKKEIASILQGSGYTREKYMEDSANFVAQDTEKEKPGFNISVIYTLENGDLTVKIPYDAIEMRDAFPLLKIQLLKYFGSPKTGDEGYFVLPDGCGSLMRFYNGKSNGHDYSVSVYGSGYALAQNEKTSNYYNASLPVFGIKNGDSAVLAEIESGSAIADINAFPGDDLEVPYAYASFRVRETYQSTLSTGKKETFLVTQKERYSGDIKLRLSFLSGKEADYNGMARLYQNRLFGNSDKTKQDVPSVTVEYIGLITKPAQMLGISYDKNVVLNTFKQAETNTDVLLQSGITNLKIKLSGWFNGGYDNKFIKSINVEDKLGGEKSFLELNQYMQDNGVPFYPDVDVQYSDSKNMFDGFDSRSDAITLINKDKGKMYQFDLASFAMKKSKGTIRYINNINAQNNALAAATSAFLDYKINSISLRLMGQDVNADFNESNIIDRQEAADAIVSNLKSLKKENFSILTEGANAFVLPYIDGCTNVPLTSNQYDNTDETIPFLMMVLSGYVDYSGTALNLSGDVNTDILRAASTGASLYCNFTSQNANEVGDSNYTNLYSTDFNYWKESIISDLSKYQNNFKNVAGQKIVSYEKLQQNVYKTTFENGSYVVVNYGASAVTIDHMQISAKSYFVLEA